MPAGLGVRPAAAMGDKRANQQNIATLHEERLRRRITDFQRFTGAMPEDATTFSLLQ